MDVRTDPGQGRSLAHHEARPIVIGMLLPVFMGSLDNTILASALPTIGREFGDAHSLPWLITIYLLGSTAVVPLYGKISDIHGRQFTLRIAIALYMLGSLVCALAPNMLVLILGRALHGVGGGGLASTGAVVLGDVVAPKERGRYYAYFAVVYTTAGASGPALGGFLSDHIHWSAIFWLNIPLGIAAAAVTTILLRRLPRHERPHRLDVIGAVLIVSASVAFMLGLNLGGRSYAWTSPPILALFAIALVVGAGFVWRLLTAPEPLIPIDVLRNPTVLASVVAHACGWGAIVGLNIFLPMYLQNVVGLSPTNAGLSLMVLMATLNASAGFSAQLLVRHRRYKIVPLIGLALAIVSVATLAIEVEGLATWKFELLIAVLGTGFGPIAPLSTTSLQNTVALHQFGTAIGTMNFTRSLYATVLVSVFGALVNTAATQGPARAASHLDVSGFQLIFAAAAISLTVAFIAIVLLEEKPFRTGL